MTFQTIPLSTLQLHPFLTKRAFDHAPFCVTIVKSLFMSYRANRQRYDVVHNGEVIGSTGLALQRDQYRHCSSTPSFPFKLLTTPPFALPLHLPMFQQNKAILLQRMIVFVDDYSVTNHAKNKSCRKAINVKHKRNAYRAVLTTQETNPASAIKQSIKNNEKCKHCSILQHSL